MILKLVERDIKENLSFESAVGNGLKNPGIGRDFAFNFDSFDCTYVFYNENNFNV